MNLDPDRPWCRRSHAVDSDACEQLSEQTHLFRMQGCAAAIERYEPGVVVSGERNEVRVRDLPVADDAGQMSSFDWQRVRPEHVPLLGADRFEYPHRSNRRLPGRHQKAKQGSFGFRTFRKVWLFVLEPVESEIVVNVIDAMPGSLGQQHSAALTLRTTESAPVASGGGRRSQRCFRLQRMTIRPGTPSTWAPRLTKADVKHFLRLVEERLIARRLVFTGTAPLLVDHLGRELFLGNLAAECAQQSRSTWPSAITNFIDAIACMSNIDDPAAVSPEVVRRSLRLRLHRSTRDTGMSTYDPMQDLIDLIVRRPGMPDTEWYLYLRRPGAGQGVIAEHLEQWGIDADEAFALARENTLADERGVFGKRNGLFMESGDSMFAHAGVLALIDRLPRADGYVVAVPNRHETLAAPVPPDEYGLRAVVAMLHESLTRYDNASPIHPFAWFVPASGIGTFGEKAELIRLVNDAPDGAEPEVGMSFGPLLHEHLANLG